MPALVFSLLGPLRIEHQQLGAITISNRKVIALLVYLLVESDRAHSREFLLGLLWPDLPTAAAQNNLRVTWAQLQKALGASNSDEQPYLIANRLALRFNSHSDHEVDITHFRGLLDACRRHLHSDPNSCPECAARLTEALTLLHGDFLSSDFSPSDFLEDFSLDNCLQFDEWLLMQRQQLHVQVTAALEQLATFHETNGQLTEAERNIRRLLEYDPLNESAYRQLMRVLAGSDQRSAALDLYERCRHLLASELGVAPAVETVVLAEQIRAVAPFESPSTQAGIPPVLTRFFGRQQESARLVDLLFHPTIRLVTVTGPGGVGKTRLAVDLAHRLTGLHAICFVELAGVVDGSAVDDALAAALQLPTSSGRSSLSTIVEYLHDKKLLLILDNCEHLVKACATLVQTLCRTAAGLTVLATSRVPLHLAEEQVIRLEPFATPVFDARDTRRTQRLTVAESLRFDSVRLFTDRATQAMLHFALTDSNVLAVARICQQLDGIPLAIEIAAAQARALSVEAIAERLSQRFAWLNRQTGESVSRQRTLHTLIDWSYGLLSYEARALLRRLAVFAGGWTLEAAEALTLSGEACAEILVDLVDHSLVVFGADAERRRYAMHETIRQFAREHLRGSDQEATVLEAHARYYAQLVARAAENSSAQSMIERLRLIQEDHDNLRAAFEWLVVHDGEQALTVVAQLGRELEFWEVGGFFQEGRRWLQRALERTEGSISIARAEALLAASHLSSAICDFDYGLQAIRSAQAIFHQLGDQRGEIDARLDYCNLADLAGEPIDLQTEIDTLLQMAERISYVAGIARARMFLGTLIFEANGDFEGAIQHLLPIVALWREEENSYQLASALNWLGVSLVQAKQYPAAWEAHQESRLLFETLGYRRGVALALHNLGEIACEMGDYWKARDLLCESLRIRRQLGLPRGYTYSFEGLAQLNENEEQSERAVQLWAAADSLRKHLGAPLELAAQKHVTASLTRLRSQLGDLAFELEWSKGTTMTTEQAIQLALS